MEPDSVNHHSSDSNHKLKRVSQHSDRRQILSGSHSNRLVVYSAQLLRILVDLEEAQALVNHKQGGACQVNHLLAVQPVVLDKMLPVGSNLRQLVLEDSKHSRLAAYGALQLKVTLLLDNNLNKLYQALVNQQLKVLVRILSNLALCRKVKAHFRICLRQISLILEETWETHLKRYKLRAKVSILSNSTTRRK